MVLLSVKELQDSLDYDPESGEFTRRATTSINPKVREGAVAGTSDTAGYINIRIGKARYLAHRLAWLYTYGEFPEGDLDHINGIKSDNRISNLREATRSQNMANTGTPKHNSSGTKGVCFDKANKKWMAYLQINKQFKNLGRFDSKEAAIDARKKAEAEAFGEFCRA